MFKLSYIDINYQNREIITLLRVDEKGKNIESLRASSENGEYIYGTTRRQVIKYLNRSVSQDAAFFYQRATVHYNRSEQLLGAERVDDTNLAIVDLWNRTMNLVQRQFLPEGLNITFAGEPVYREGGMSSGCYFLEITQVRAELIQIINQLFDEARNILPRTQPILA